MHVLRTGLGRVNSGVGGHSHAGTRPVSPRRICALQLHAGTADRLARGHKDLRSCVACSSEWVGGRRLPHPAELASNSGLLTNESGQRLAALRSTVQFANLLQRDVPGPGPASYLTAGVHSSFELMARAHGRSPTSSFLFCTLFSDALFSDTLGLPHAAYLDSPHWREWEVAVGRYRTLFVAFGIRSQDILLRLPNRRLYIGPHVQEYLAGLDTEWEERPTRCTLGVQDALEEGIAPPPFPVQAAPPPRGTESTIENEPRLKRQLEQEHEAPGSSENPQDEGSGNTMPEEQPGTPRARSEAASTTPEVTVPSNWGGEGGGTR